jgi:hypothetical protein
MAVFRDTAGKLRWLGVFAETVGGRLLFFPGFSEIYRHIRSEHRGAHSTARVLVDHLALEADLSRWAFIGADSDKELRIDQTARLGWKRVLWFGMTVKGPKFFKPVRASTIARVLLHQDCHELQSGLAEVVRLARVELVTVRILHGEPPGSALRFSVVVDRQDTSARGGMALSVLNAPGSFVRWPPPLPGTLQTRRQLVMPSGAVTLKVVGAQVSAETTCNVEFVCPDRIPFRARIGMILSGAAKSLRSRFTCRPQSDQDSPQAPQTADAAPGETPTVGQLNYWVKPPTALPMTKSPFRFAVGTPDGASSNSWVLIVEKRGDVYLKCRDSFHEWKVSLHASGRWRLGLTAESLRKCPQLVSAGADRAWDKWSPPPDHDKKAVFAFQLVYPSRDLFVTPVHREGDKPLVFVEPHPDSAMMTVVSVCIVPSLDPVVLDGSKSVAGILAVIPLDRRRSVQLVANYEDASGFEAFWDDTVAKLRARVTTTRTSEQAPEDLMVLVNGVRDNGIRWVGASLLRKV